MAKMMACKVQDMRGLYLQPSNSWRCWMQVVDGGNWLWRPQRIQREVVYEVARKVEAKSRALLPAAKSKL